MLEIDFNKCTGCEMCAEICPTHAISFVIKDGFRIPTTNQELCVNCELCNKKCPAKNSIPKKEYPLVYAGWTKDENQRVQCTSGGIAFELSKYILETGGCVAGVAWMPDFKNAEYQLIDDISLLPLITQTKYFQPEMKGIYGKVKNALKNGKKVLFFGTSCSNAGLLSYLNKEYDNLICCDFICRGYTSQLYHAKRVDSLEKEYNAKVVGIQYKNKDKGWEYFGTKFNFENGKVYYVNRVDDPYEYMLSIDDYLTRKSCFECKYRDSNRITDITLGDFWGIKDVENVERQKGISTILVNTVKGKDLLNCIKYNLHLENRQVWEIVKGNRCLKGQLRYKEGREKFYKDLDNKSINEIHHRYGNIFKYRLRNKLVKMHKGLTILSKINVMRFIHLNFFSKNVVRKKRCFIIPYKGSKFNIEKGACLNINGTIYFNAYKHKGSNEQTYIHIYSGGTLNINGTVKIAANSTIDVLKDATLSIGQSDANYNLVVICANEINIGDDVEFGRNVTLYDSNYHPTGLSKSIKGQPLNIGNHVWLCTGVCITKGITIKDGAICGINSTVTRNVKDRAMVLGNPAKVVMENVEW